MASNAAATVATAGGATSKNQEPTWPPWSLARDQVVFSASRGEGRSLEIVVLRDGPGDNDWALGDRPVLRNGDRVHVLKVPAADDEFVLTFRACGSRQIVRYFAQSSAEPLFL